MHTHDAMLAQCGGHHARQAPASCRPARTVYVIDRHAHTMRQGGSSNTHDIEEAGEPRAMPAGTRASCTCAPAPACIAFDHQAQGKTKPWCEAQADFRQGAWHAQSPTPHHAMP
jgi:hypothetical protein